MFKILLLVCFITLISCKMEDQRMGDSTGGLIELVEGESMQPADAARLTAVCQALSFKSDQLSVMTSQSFVFSYSYKSCDSSKGGVPSMINVTLERPYGNYIFEATHGESFPFPDVETDKVGVLARACANIGNLTTAYRISETGAMWVTTVSDSKRCNPDAGNYCVHLQRGSLEGGSSYRIHTNEWIKFKLTNPRRGFFTERTLVSTASCSNGKSMEKKVVLQ